MQQSTGWVLTFQHSDSEAPMFRVLGGGDTVDRWNGRDKRKEKEGGIRG